MTGKPLISVVMCAYNAERYISDAITSILNQTYSNFEFIIWDDGSVDNTKSIVESFGDRRIRYFYHENTGLGMALRLACNEAHGKYIARMDADDVSFSDRFEREIEYLESHEDCVLVSSAVNFIDENNAITGRVFPCSSNVVLKKMLYGQTNPLIHPMVMMRNDVYQEAGGYIPIRKSQDALFWSRLGKYGKFFNISRPLGCYRISLNSLDNSYNPYRMVLVSLLKKMMYDETIMESDIDVYNNLFLYSKQFKNRNIQKDRKHSINEVKLYRCLSTIIGNNLSERFITGCKNIYYYIKLFRVKICYTRISNFQKKACS